MVHVKLDCHYQNSFSNRPAALVYYHMAAETGLETGLFNTAYLCDENNVSYVMF